MATWHGAHARDIPFAVPFVHRLRFTSNVLRQDAGVLLELLVPSGTGPPRVQFWVDEHVAQAQAGLRKDIELFCGRYRDRLEWVGPIEHIPGGEQIKNDIHVLERILRLMHAADLDRRSYVVVLGGGAVLDAVGFAAAIAHRGIRLVRLPTTTLSQADSGIGVKNSVNLFQKKNWLGTFAVPWGVVNDAALLQSLSDRDFLCGFSEAVKVSLLKSREMFDRWSIRLGPFAAATRRPRATSFAGRLNCTSIISRGAAILSRCSKRGRWTSVIGPRIDSKRCRSSPCGMERPWQSAWRWIASTRRWCTAWTSRMPNES